MSAPNRHKKHDRLTYGGASKEEIECDFATGPLDRVVTQYDKIYGVDRLVELQTPEVARKYGARMAELNDCIGRSDGAATSAVVAILIANLHRMNELAIAAGHKPLAPEVWEFELDGQTVGIIRETGDWRAAEAMRPNVTLFSMREVALALQAYGNLVVAAKEAFPGAQVTAVRKPTELEESLNDEIPWV